MSHLRAHKLIIERLRAQCPRLRAVEGARSIQDVLERAIPTPAALVVYAGEDIRTGPGYTAEQGGVQVVVQKFHVEFITNNAEDYLTGAGAEDEAGEALTEIIEALAGYELAVGMGKLQRVNSAQAMHVEGWSYYP